MGTSISLCMIALNEEQNLPRCLDSVQEHVDELVVVDTGSVDGTLALAERRGARTFRFDRTTNPESFFRDDESTGIPGPYTGLWTLADFARARNASFGPATKDFVLWLDADDVLEDGAALRDIVAEMERDAMDAGWLAYESGTRRWWRERLMRRSTSPTWYGDVHEAVPAMGVGKWRKFGRPLVRHTAAAPRAQARIAHRNLKILAATARRAGAAADPRTLFYLGNESRYVDEDMAISAYGRYITVSTWDEERALARFRLGAIFERQGKYADAAGHYLSSAVDDPGAPAPLHGLARLAYYDNDWGRCAELTERGLAIPARESVVPLDNADRAVTPHFYYSMALWQLGRRDEAMRSCEMGLAEQPLNQHMKSNKIAFQAAAGVVRPRPAPESPPCPRTRILAKFPTRSRPEKFFATFSMWKSRLSGRHDVEFVVTIDDDDETMNRPDILGRLRAEGCEVTVSAARTKVGACNHGVEGRDFGILILLSDDMIPRVDGWDDIVARDMAARFPAMDGALHYDDGFTGSNLCTMSVMGERLYRQFGYVYSPAYRSLWCDNEYTDIVRQIEKHAYMARVLARHEHPANVGGAPDALLVRNEAPYAEDRAVYERRKSEDFGLRQPVLSILIPSLRSRAGLLAELLACLRPQLDRLSDPWSVELRILTDAGEAPVGTKRNRLLRDARGRYVSFVDDDDMVADSYVEDIMAAMADPAPDCVVFNGMMTTDGKSPTPFMFSKDYLADRNLDDAYLRIPNHICAVRADLAKPVLFPRISVGEDSAWAKALLPRLQTEAKIQKTLYYYRWRPGSVSWAAPPAPPIL